MIKNYIKIAFRSLRKNTGFTVINILGLSIGLATCLLIVFYVADELSYDQFNKKADRIVRANFEIKFGGNNSTYAQTMAPLAQVLETEFPEVETTVRLKSRGGVHVKKDNQNIQEDMMVYSDPGLFDVFTLPMIDGNASTALVEPNSVVITETIAKKYFNSVNVVGKTLVLNDNENYKVTGVIKDIPKQSHFNYDFFLSMSSLEESKETTWLSNNFNTYILLKPGADYKKLNAKLPALMRKHMNVELQSIVHLTMDEFEKAGNYFRMNLTPLTDIHLYSNRVGELGRNGSILYVYIFSAIAIFILLIACVNFMNLSTARSSNRAREVGVRKVLGSPRSSLIAQFLIESILLTFVSTLIAVILAWVMLPLFNQISNKELAITLQSLRWLLPAIIIITLFIGCLAGFYPAFFLSAFQPVDVLKGKLSAGFKGGMLRSFLVVFQFSISIILIIGTLIIYNQLNYIQHKNLGYDRNQVLIVKNTAALGSQAKVFKQEIKQLPGVDNATMTGYLPTAGYRNTSSLFQDPTLDQKRAILPQVWSVDEGYLNTLGIKIVTGRNFSEQLHTDSSSVIINETAARLLGLKQPLNKPLYRPMDNAGKIIKKFTIVGVIKDFHFSSLRDNISPVTLFLEDDYGALSIRVHTKNITSLLAQVADKWKSLAPNQQFAYSFMDQDFEATYRSEQRTGRLFLIFTTLAIAIACLGLFGLAAYAAEQRTKEIGIRKVLGANVSIIVAMLSKDFIKLVFIAILISSPLAWFFMNKWLQGFAYRINFQWWVIVLAGAVAIFIAFVTISFQSIKSAIANPVKSLKSE
ncbi:ABC transporter permease [Mucilaginibacter sp. SP1R1]|uniref:ABC transporter permease n=1 Tax=Mucilaginibacter sp. SP1R1 TaxID=2723091 RepID=UPI00160E7A8B|nr:ABC transporter permease [Mucilaginibacter sp. SP1R1]MBB6148771.1 putative ABC transport system permease protein [Mucilaginibacter sp. SP1R1]